MSLGVLNNLSAVYAENNLNNTNDSLSKTLQQLSSGSRINSGADDAAGLSLVDGLQANQMALGQSQTNATEGVGLLQVADGALSQVTSLLNRAVTLATEASNGTLNSSQDTAANQEYQSILSEINNIGSTTTYNQQKVFGGPDVAIYTGDSSTLSASQDDLHFAQVTSASVGDANGSMQYSAGQNVFLDSGGTTADASSVVGATGIAVDVWDSLSGGVVTKTITGTAGETLGAFAAQINSSNIGVVATITTGAAAGDAGNADTGLEIQGNITSAAGAGSDPEAAGQAASIDTTNAGFTLAIGGTAFTAVNDNAGSSSALISYQAGANGSADLTQNNLTTQAGAQDTLTALNAAITDVAAQDGYIGAQINTLNAVSSVISTQAENMQSAQNAVQATDYASASSNMSKYEILSQTGISALAQANSMQQEVTKLLQ
ncbi:MAG TPA: flagellin [Terracidiphilus sp.]|nr:flagellin [Terracidiphilus sp.]